MPKLGLAIIEKYGKNKLVFSLILILFAVWSFPNVLSTAMGGLDPSWQIALHMAKLENLVWGQDLMMTNGPLAYLVMKINIDQTLWIQSFFYKVGAHILFFITIGIFTYKTKNRFRNIIAFGILSILLTAVTPTYYPLLGLLLGWYLYLEYSKRYLFLIPLSFFTAFFSFIKGDVFLGSLSIISLSCIIFIIQKKWKEVVISSGAYVLFIFLIWLAMKFPITALDGYYINMISISSGYAIAMSIDRLLFPVYFAIPLWGLYFWWIVDSFKKSRDLKFFFISAGVLFLTYKLGVVREGGHALHFFLFWSAIMLIFLIISKKNKIPTLLKYTTICFVAFFVFSTMFTAYIIWPSEKYSSIDSNFVINGISETKDRFLKAYSSPKIQFLPNYITYLSDDITFETIRNIEKEKIKEFYPSIPKNTLETIGKNSIDVIPWDNALLYAYDLNWTPRFFLQSIGAYTSHLDKLDAEFFMSENAPLYILYEWKSIDGRFPAFDTPLTYRTILCNYEIVDTFEKWYLLKRSENKICTNMVSIQKIEIKFGEEVLVPKSTENYVFVKIFVKENVLGKASNLLYKSPHVFIQLNNNEISHRFVYPTAENGILLFVDSQTENTPLLKYNVNSFTIHTNYENYFEDIISIEFFEMS